MPPATTTSAKRTTRTSAKTEDAIAFLKSEHRDVEELFKRFEGLGDTAHKSRQATVGKMIEALSKHAAIEEQVLYPAVRDRVEGEQDDLVLEALEEHHLVKLTLRELESMPSTDERYKAKVTVLTESVRHHVEEEEKELFPDVRKLFSRAELVELGAQLRAAKKSAPARPHPLAPDEPPASIIANTLAAPLDAAAKVASTAAQAVRRVAP